MQQRFIGVGRVAAALLACVMLGWCGMAQAQERGALFTDGFETGTGAWMAAGPHGKVSLTTDADHVKSGKGALAFGFTVVRKSDLKAGLPVPFDVLVRPTPNGELAKMKALTFWARSDIAGAYAVSLQEKGGGRYVTMIWLQKDQWQKVVVNAEELWLADDKNDPKDPDGRLDPDQVESVTLLSVWSFVAIAAEDTPQVSGFVTPALGAHILWLDDFSALAEAPAEDLPAFPEKTTGLWVDAMRRDAPMWLMLGKGQIAFDPKSPLKGRALRAEYAQEQGTYTALIHDLRRFNLTPLQRFELDFASAKSARVGVALETKAGARYSVLIDVPGDGMPIHRSIPFTDFIHADDSPQDPDGRLHLDQLKTLSFVDLTAAFGLGKQNNTLWIGPISAVTPKP